jgi:hypothetical protein
LTVPPQAVLEKKKNNLGAAPTGARRRLRRQTDDVS